MPSLRDRVALPVGLDVESVKDVTPPFVDPADVEGAVAAGGVVVDVRTDEERRDGCVAGSHHVPYALWEAAAEAGLQGALPAAVAEVLDSTGEVVFHCMYSQERAPRCAVIARQLRPTLRVAILRGGFQRFLAKFWDGAAPPPACLVSVNPAQWVPNGNQGLVWATDHPEHAFKQGLAEDVGDDA
eukprot:TRINITY_DN11116_c0_g1_i1.p2 TRINITY_DN11116_c0_g1~~TRINITY_DN11116_c0_g1_i1.p2  ORF type:complete len:185 (+),score=59.24 TRINITY_DN11116_c0_g1_i1:38-592(+)